MSNEIAIAPSPDVRPAALFTPTSKAARRVLGFFIEFFTATIRNRNARLAYARACCQFFHWC
jgi:hypothetical protein